MLITLVLSLTMFSASCGRKSSVDVPLVKFEVRLIFDEFNTESFKLDREILIGNADIADAYVIGRALTPRAVVVQIQPNDKSTDLCRSCGRYTS